MVFLGISRFCPPYDSQLKMNEIILTSHKTQTKKKEQNKTICLSVPVLQVIVIPFNELLLHFRSIPSIHSAPGGEARQKKTRRRRSKSPNLKRPPEELRQHIEYVYYLLLSWSKKNQQNDPGAKWRLRSAWASAQSDKSLLSAWWSSWSLAARWARSKNSDQMCRLMWVLKGTNIILLVLSCSGSFVLVMAILELCKNAFVSRCNQNNRVLWKYLLVHTLKAWKYHKFHKYLDTRKIAVITLKFEQCVSTIE